LKTLRQILAIAHTEFLFGLRRGGPVVIPLLIGLVIGAGILWFGTANLGITRADFRQFLQDSAKIEQWKEKGLTVDFFRQTDAGSVAEDFVLSIPQIWPVLLLATFLLLPAATATSLPADHAFGVAELLHSLPLGAGTYLAGKVIGVALTVVLVGLIPLGLFFGVLEWIFLDAFQLSAPADLIAFFVKFTLLDGLPILVWGLMIGILVGSVFRTRRAAVILGLLDGILSIFFWLIAFSTPSLPFGQFGQMDAAAYYLIQNYHSMAMDALDKLTGTAPYPLLGANTPVIGIGRVMMMYLIIAVTLLILAVFARLWMKWKENF